MILIGSLSRGAGIPAKNESAASRGIPLVDSFFVGFFFGPKKSDQFSPTEPPDEQQFTVNLTSKPEIG